MKNSKLSDSMPNSLPALPSEARNSVVRLDCSNIRFGSQLDEKHLFSWAGEIEGFLRWDQDVLVMCSKRISEATLRDLIALFFRYQIPMRQLAQFENKKNVLWFRATHTYWNQHIFGT